MVSLSKWTMRREVEMMARGSTHDMRRRTFKRGREAIAAKRGEDRGCDGRVGERGSEREEVRKGVRKG